MREYLRDNISEIITPGYYFDVDEFNTRASMVKKEIGDIPLTYSIKANPFLLNSLPDCIDKVEVCSPGELEICIGNKIAPEKIIYSGVNKGTSDVTRAINYGVDIVTAESLNHLSIEQEVANKKGILQKTILRLSSGNQFGMSEDDIISALKSKGKYANLNLVGIHFYSGTQKNTTRVEKDFDQLSSFLEKARQEADFVPDLVEIGPGITTDYFSEKCNEKDIEALKQVGSLIRDFSKKYTTGIEMGRFLAASCGTYATRVCDLKYNDETNYVICDGGIHHIKYYGQNMAMQVPEMEALNNQTDKDYYCICGSLCTTADVLVREVELPRLSMNDIILFHRCGAYSVTEGSALFLSREFPAVYLYSKKKGLDIQRKIQQSFVFNMTN